MIYLVLNIILSSSFILTFRWLQQRADDILTVGAINYIIGGLFAAAVFFSQDDPAYSTVSGFAGAANGTGYFVGFFLLLAIMTWKGAAITAVFTRLSILIPMAGGILIWQECPTRGQWLGISLGCLSLALISTRGRQVASAKSPAYVPLIIVAFFLASGGSRFVQEAFKHEGNQTEQPAYLLAVFGLAGLASLLMMVARRKGPTLTELTIGAFVGLANVLQVWCTLKALESYDGFVVFPVTSAGGLLFTAMVAVIFLHERLTRVSYGGIVMAVCSMALLR